MAPWKQFVFARLEQIQIEVSNLDTFHIEHLYYIEFVVDKKLKRND